MKKMETRIQERIAAIRETMSLLEDIEDQNIIYSALGDYLSGMEKLLAVSRVIEKAEVREDGEIGFTGRLKPVKEMRNIEF